MLIREPWTDLASGHGIVLAASPPGQTRGHVRLGGEMFPSTDYVVHRLERAPTRQDVLTIHAAWLRGPETAIPARPLVVAPSAGSSTLAEARRLGVSLLVVDPSGGPLRGALVGADGSVHPIETAAPHVPRRATGRVPWATFEAALQLLAAPAPTQADLASRVGVSQPRMAQVLAGWGGLVRRDPSGWHAEDGLAAWLVEHYPASPRVTFSWLTLDAPVPAAEAIASHLASLHVDHAVTGDVAADRLAPWARPRTVRMWARSIPDLTPLGLTPAPPESANVVIAVPADPYVLSRTREVAGMRLADPWRVWLDLEQHDATDAAAHLAASLREEAASA